METTTPIHLLRRILRPARRRIASIRPQTPPSGGMETLFAVTAIVSTAAVSAADESGANAFAELIEAHHSADAMSITFTMTLELRESEVASEPREVDGRLLVGPNGAGVLELSGYRSMIDDNQISVLHEQSADSRYVSVEAESGRTVAAMLHSMFASLPVPPAALHWAGDDPATVASLLHPQTPTMRPSGVDRAQDGRRVIVLAGDDARMELTVDASTGLLTRAAHVIDGGRYAPRGVSIHREWTFKYEPIDEQTIAEAVTFEPADRRRVERLAALRDESGDRQRVAIGGAEALEGRSAPDLVLTTADGGSFDLRKHRGKVVVLDFWATWCQPCHRVLPLLHEIDDWAESENLPVTIVTVNVLEHQHDSSEDRLEAVRAFWKQGGYALPIAMDYSGDVARDFAVQAIPMTIVIDGEGIVESVHIGAGGEYRTSIENAIMDALEP